MNAHHGVSIVGGGAIGFSLAVHLRAAGKDVTVLRVGTGYRHPEVQTVVVQSGDGSTLTQEIASRPLSSASPLSGLVVLAAKANANTALAHVLAANAGAIDLVLMQNGIGVEKPFMGRHFRSLSRCVVYITAEMAGPGRYTARMMKPSPVGLVEPADVPMKALVATLCTPGLAFSEETDIRREVWKKGIINTVFNSVCPLVDVDNGIFDRDDAVKDLARRIVRECVPVARGMGIDVDPDDILEQILLISRRSSGQLISTLQDIRAHRETEIAFFNLEICRMAESMKPPMDLPLTRALGLLTQRKSAVTRESGAAHAAP